MRWVEIINVLINDDGFIITIKDGYLTGMKYFDVDFCKNYNSKDANIVQNLCVDILDYSDSLKYTNPSLAEITRACVDVILDNKSVGVWVQDDFYFKKNELC
jgi:hypothetical protein